MNIAAGLVILAGTAGAIIGFKKGLYVMFAALFNLLAAAFIAVLSVRPLWTLSTDYEMSAAYAAVCLLLLFILVFGFLQTAGWFYFLRDRQPYFPLWLDKPAAALLGYLAGYLTAAVLLLCVCILPYSAQGKLDWLLPRDQMKKIAAPSVAKACNFLAWYSLECFDGDTEQAMDYLLTLSEPKIQEPVRFYIPQEPSKSNPPKP